MYIYGRITSILKDLDNFLLGLHYIRVGIFLGNWKEEIFGAGNSCPRKNGAGKGNFWKVFRFDEIEKKNSFSSFNSCFSLKKSFVVQKMKKWPHSSVLIYSKKRNLDFFRRTLAGCSQLYRCPLNVAISIQCQAWMQRYSSTLAASSRLWIGRDYSITLPEYQVLHVIYLWISKASTKFCARRAMRRSSDGRFSDKKFYDPFFDNQIDWRIRQLFSTGPGWF